MKHQNCSLHCCGRHLLRERCGEIKKADSGISCRSRSYQLSYLSPTSPAANENPCPPFPSLSFPFNYTKKTLKNATEGLSRHWQNTLCTASLRRTTKIDVTKLRLLGRPPEAEAAARGIWLGRLWSTARNRQETMGRVKTADTHLRNHQLNKFFAACQTSPLCLQTTISILHPYWPAAPLVRSNFVALSNL